MDQTKIHELIVKVKDLAVELGKAPTKIEMFNAGISDHAIRSAGGVTAIHHAAGLSPEKAKKIDNSIFLKDIESHIESFEPKTKEAILPIKLESTVIFGDTHFPFIHEPSLNKALEIIGQIKPKYVVQVGDLYDMLAHSKFPRSLNTYTPLQEMELGRKMAAEMWASVRKISPKSECHQILGNHDIRPMKRIIEAYPEAEIFMDFEKWFKFDGVTSHMDIRKELNLGGILYIHGHRSKLGEHMEFFRRCVVHGHSHKGGVYYKNMGDSILWELDAGYLGDPESKALSYTPTKHTHSTHGLGVIDEYGPRFIAL